MNKYIVSYDLIKVRDYKDVHEKLKSFGGWARPLESVWVIKSSLTISEVRDEMQKVLDSDDKLIVMELTGNWGTYNISKNVTDWLKDNI